MGALLVSQIASRVRRQFGDLAGVQITDAAMFDWINDAMRAIVLDNDLLRVKSTNVSVPGTANYALPADLLRLHSFSFNGQPIEELSLMAARRSIPNIDDASLYPQGTPEQYWIWGSEIFLYPAPSTAQTILIYYNRNPVEVTAVGNTPELPARYDSRLVEYCLAQAAELDDDDARHAKKMGEFESGLEKAKDEENTSGVYPHLGVPLPDSYGASYRDFI